ncbi:hypothetical protein EDD16DRAFT_1517763 [Pisolithus croceorrhizus]|nr:hypothetical protein EDD16DRAFT_1517763 [Pisolithus croceorrhizus]
MFESIQCCLILSSESVPLLRNPPAGLLDERNARTVGPEWPDECARVLEVPDKTSQCIDSGVIIHKDNPEGINLESRTSAHTSLALYGYAQFVSLLLTQARVHRTYLNTITSRQCLHLVVLTPRTLIRIANEIGSIHDVPGPTRLHTELPGPQNPQIDRSIQIPGATTLSAELGHMQTLFDAEETYLEHGMAIPSLRASETMQTDPYDPGRGPEESRSGLSLIRIDLDRWWRHFGWWELGERRERGITSCTNRFCIVQYGLARSSMLGLATFADDDDLLFGDANVSNTTIYFSTLGGELGSSNGLAYILMNCHMSSLARANLTLEDNPRPKPTCKHNS